MMSLELNLYTTMIGSFGIILIGYFFGRCKVITVKQGKGISLYMVNIALPALIFKALVTIDFKLINWMLWGGIFAAKTILFTIVVFLSLMFQKEDKFGKAGLYGIFVTQSNDFAFGIPIVESIFNSPSNRYLVDYIYLVAPVSLAFLNPIGFSMMEYEKAKKKVLTVPNEANKSRQMNNAQIFKRVLMITIKGIITNPLVFMILFSIVFNFIFQQKIPMLLTMFINNVSSSFGATALFYLGWCLGSKETPLKGLNYLLPIVLVLAKGILLPIIMKTTVSWMVRPGKEMKTNSTYYNDQETFGFLYGTIPTAPTVVVFASMYGISEDVVASGLVFGTILCAPIIFASVQMIRVLDMKDVDKFCDLVTIVSKDVSIFNVVCCVWVLVVFGSLRLHRRVPHCYTLVLVSCQLVIGIIGSFYDVYCKIANQLALQILYWLLLVAMYGYCAWTIVISLAMSFGSNTNVIRWLVGLAVITPPVLATIVVTVYKEMIPSKPLSSPYFMLSCNNEYDHRLGVGAIYVVMNILVLISVAVALVKLNKSTLFKKNVQEDEETDPLIRKSKSGQNLDYCGSCSYERDERPCVDQNGDIQNMEDYSVLNDILEEEKHQLTITGYTNSFHVANHVILVFLMGLLSVVNSAVAFWYIVSEKNESGLYLELQMLGVVLTFGQGFFTFMTFGLLKELFLLPFIERLYTCFGALKRSRAVWLPDEESLDPDVVDTCKRFMQNHYKRCKEEIVKDNCFRMNRSVKHVFKGTSLVDWIISSSILTDRGEAIAYGNKLLLGRIIRHVSDERFFYDLPYFYEFICDERSSINDSNCSGLADVGSEVVSPSIICDVDSVAYLKD